jgi:hypothetical protein
MLYIHIHSHNNNVSSLSEEEELARRTALLAVLQYDMMAAHMDTTAASHCERDIII